jgi:uncharacterized protein YuzE
MTTEIFQDYDKENDIMYVHWGKDIIELIELLDGNIVLDLDKDLNIVGLEIFNFREEVLKFSMKMEKIFKKSKLKGKGK